MLKISYLILIIAIVAGLLLWPQSLGGETAYVTYNQGDIGSSLQLGDLAVMRRARDYTVGDLVAVQTSDGPAVFGWIAGKLEPGYWVSLDPKKGPVVISEQYVLGRLWFNLGDVSRGLTGSILNSVGIQVATSR